MNKSNLSKTEVQHLEQLLAIRFKELDNMIKKQLHPDGKQELSITTPTDADDAISDQLVDEQLTQVESRLREIDAIHVAQESIRNKSYGICVDCNLPIRYERLLTNPTSMRCIECQTALERRSGNSHQSRIR
jgi:DnaK suppressor protein